MQRILSGDFEDGRTFPTEFELCDQYEMSRVTVRKALDELKKDGIIASVQGQGTKVAERPGGYPGSLDMIALVAEVHNPFFASFMEHFERIAERNGSLVLFKQDFNGDAFHEESLFFRLIQKNIRNLVFWPNSERIDFRLLRRLRTVGANMVFFDQQFQTGTADVVCLNNERAVSGLYAEMRRNYRGKIIFIGFDTLAMPSEALREQAFVEAAGDAKDIYRIPYGKDIEQETSTLLDSLLQQGVLPAGILCCNGPIGLAAAKHLQRLHLQALPLGAIDYLPEMEKFDMIVYRQPMDRLAEQTYGKLAEQNRKADTWQASVIQLEGEIVRFGGYYI